ncbi:MAG: AAA family ATPase [Paludibacteraceae bacterium]|nr:AAA family ATPase [Paludibacteraceae bacterium]
MCVIKLQRNLDSDIMGGHYNESFDFGKLYMSLFGSVYSSLEIDREVFVKKLFGEIVREFNVTKDKIFTNAFEEECKIDYDYISFFIIIKERFCVGIDRTSSATILFDSDVIKPDLLKLYRIIKRNRKPELSLKKFYLIDKVSGKFSLSECEIKDCLMDVNLNYNDDFNEINSIIKTSLTERKNGIIFLHGKNGTGKTTYIRHLISTLNRRFIFLPLSLLEHISAPDFLPFIVKQKNSVLILEDCETIIMDRENSQRNSTSISTLLNITDGLLGDVLKITVICTFNSNLKTIDKALMRKGRLIAKYEFKELEITKANKLATELGINEVIEKPMTVADIYNYNTQGFEEKRIERVGFNN